MSVAMSAAKIQRPKTSISQNHRPSSGFQRVEKKLIHHFLGFSYSLIIDRRKQMK